jgi:hypothetical protein
VISVIALLIVALLVPSAQAHVPFFPLDNQEIASASYISDPGKSWAVYDELGGGEAQYYSFNIEKGQRIYLSLLKSTNPREKIFDPHMALMVPGGKANGTTPGFVDVPVGYGAMAIEEGMPSEHAFYEPFGPGSYYQMAELNITAPSAGIYYVTVYDPDKDEGGHYSLAIGYREEFSLIERITTPLRMISVYQWAGQSSAFILAPIFAAIAFGLILIQHNKKSTAFMSTATMAGVLFLGTSATILCQITFNMMLAPVGSEVAISLALALFHAVLGVAALRLSRGQAGLLQRVVLAVIGTSALLAGSGLIIGPLLAVAASVTRPKRRGG